MNVRNGVLLFVCISGLVGVLPANASVEAVLTMKGRVVEKTCEVPSAQLTKTIIVPAISQTALSALEENAVVTASSTPFQFDVTNCPSTVKRVGVLFDYAADTAYPTYMQNTGTATGALLGISSDANTDAIATGTLIDAASIVDGAATVKAKVNAYRTSATVTAGDVASTVMVALDYD